MGEHILSILDLEGPSNKAKAGAIEIVNLMHQYRGYAPEKIGTYGDLNVLLNYEKATFIVCCVGTVSHVSYKLGTDKPEDVVWKSVRILDVISNE